MGRRPKEKEPSIGDIVYLKTDADKLSKMIVSFKIMPYNIVKYELRRGGESSEHWEFEIEKTVQERMKIKGLMK